MTGIAKNLRLFPWYLLSTTEGISNAVWFLYLFSYKGINLEQLAWITLLGDGIIVLAEVPTGWLADRFTRRASVLFGIFLQALSAVFFIIGNSAWSFCLAMAVCGLGDTFRSGADQALLYDSCLAVNQAARYRQLLAHSMFVMTVVLMASQIAGGLIATHISWELVFWLEICFSAVGFVMVWMMQEPPRVRDAAAQPNVSKAAPGTAHRRTAGSYALWLSVAPLALYATVTGIPPELAHFFLPAELNVDLHMMPAQLGFIYAAFELLQGCGVKIAGRQRSTPPASILPWIGLAMVGALALFGFRNAVEAWSVPAAITLYLLARGMIDFCYGLTEPLISEEANLRTPSATRATALSIVNASRKLLPLAMLPCAAVLAVNYGNILLYSWVLPPLLAVVLLAGWWLRRTARQTNLHHA